MKFKRLFAITIFLLLSSFLSFIISKKFFKSEIKPVKSVSEKNVLKCQTINLKSDKTLYFKKSDEDKNINESLNICDKNKFIIFNTDYKQIKNIFNDYKFSYSNFYNNCNLIYKYLYGDKLKNIILNFNRYQKICRFPNTSYLTNKNLLLKNLKKAKELYPEEYDFFIESYILPDDKDVFKDKVNKSKFWVKKPYNSSRGRGVKIVNKITDFDEKVIIQKYINPHLLFGKKYDIRIILLITSYDPLICYLYTDGVLRFATHPYSEKEDFYIEDKFMHLTNNCVNKDSLFFKKNDDPNKLAESLASLKSFKQYCLENNIDFESIKDKIKDKIIKCILMRYDKCVEELKDYKLKSSKNLFELIGVDVILDSNLEPHILEFNLNPSLEWNCKCGEIIHKNILIDTFNLIGIKQYDRNVNNNKRMSAKEMFEENIAELKRVRGGYELIFPLKENIKKYSKFIKSDTNLNKLLWSYIEKNT